jgi:hypothetical protein
MVEGSWLWVVLKVSGLAFAMILDVCASSQLPELLLLIQTYSITPRSSSQTSYAMRHAR